MLLVQHKQNIIWLSLSPLSLLLIIIWVWHKFTVVKIATILDELAVHSFRGKVAMKEEAMSSLKTSINSISTHSDTQEASPVNMDHSKMQLSCTPFSFFF
jgi:hypothetical protein